jgi:hypothetical protein
MFEWVYRFGTDFIGENMVIALERNFKGKDRK